MKIYGLSRVRDEKGAVVKRDETICLNSKVEGKQPPLQERVYWWGGCSTAVTTCFMPYVMTYEDKTNQDMAKKYRIRKLTPTECFRLMGVHDGDIELIKGAGISDSQCYRMAGNSIVVPVLEGIFIQLLRKDAECLF